MPIAVADCVVDTNVVSYMFRSDSRAEPYREYLAGKKIGLSFMSLAGLRSWAMLRDWGSNRVARLERLVRSMTIFYVDDALCDAWATIAVSAERAGRPITPADAWIAAPAWLDSIPLVTHNRRHFEAVAGLSLISLGGS
jgi:predicted nucleic acid-binding protein